MYNKCRNNHVAKEKVDKLLSIQGLYYYEIIKNNIDQIIKMYKKIPKDKRIQNLILTLMNKKFGQKSSFYTAVTVFNKFPQDL